MDPSEKTKIKICCIQSTYEADVAIRAGANALGFVSSMPSGPGVIPEELIAEIVSAVPGDVETVLLTSLCDAEGIVDQQHRCGTKCVQLVDTLQEGALEVLRKRLPGISLMQVVHVTGPASLERAVAVARHVDALLLDSGNPHAAIRELGGTGRVHDWELSRAIVRGTTIPVYLAGGLTPENIREAIRQVRPAGVDVCTGVRRDGTLDERLLKAFIGGVREAESWTGA